METAWGLGVLASRELKSIKLGFVLLDVPTTMPPSSKMGSITVPGPGAHTALKSSKCVPEKQRRTWKPQVRLANGSSGILTGAPHSTLPSTKARLCKASEPQAVL